MVCEIVCQCYSQRSNLFEHVQLRKLTSFFFTLLDMDMSLCLFPERSEVIEAVTTWGVLWNVWPSVHMRLTSSDSYVLIFLYRHNILILRYSKIPSYCTSLGQNVGNWYFLCYLWRHKKNYNRVLSPGYKYFFLQE